MSDRKTVDFNAIHCGILPETGRFRLAGNGIGWKGGNDKTTTVSAENLKKMSWIRAARGHQLRVVLKDNTALKFDGFKMDDFEELRDAIKSFYKIQLEAKELSVKGWNWGQTDFQGSNLVFNVSNRTMFELPLAQAIGANKPGKNEVAVNFVDPGQPAPEGMNPKEVDELMDVTFYIPGTVSKETDKDEEDGDEEEVNADTVFYETVKSKLEFSQMTTENIVQFQEVLCLTPRGRYNIDMYQDFLRLRGKTYDYKILYSNIIKLFLLLKPDEMHVLFVIGLDPPLRQGQTKYPFLVFQFVRDDEIDVELNLDEGTLDEKYENKLQKHYDAPTYEVVSTIFRGLTGRKVTVPGKDTYRSHHGAHALKCSLKANEGYLYPLDKSFLFIPKPPTFIPLNEIGVVTFSRLGTSSGGSSRTFDMKFRMKSGNTVQFSSINREEYANLEDFLKQKKIKIKSEGNEETIVSYAELDDDIDEDENSFESSRKKRRTEIEEGADDDESPDEDFAPEDDSDVPEEYDSEAQGSSPGEGSDED
ncbi:FACT complex subunit [Apophysomyces sp. BC1034]|nr:FACT complex subunit [Apophysomyces sp. BC1015]KAG0181031.1 FACT complex subunit [Apophysomyces sp. BC1021]KAG0192273.1 FACT complex subunit [Apophysomyces sp. BC1034]